MPTPAPDAATRLARVTAVRPCGDDAFVVSMRPEVAMDPVRASRFFMLKRTDGSSPLIPRPFSLYRQRGDELEFLLKVIGRGTRALAESQPGDEVRVTGPLGNGWPTLDGDGPKWVMLAGGVGLAPFPMAIEQARAGMDGATPVPTGGMHLLFGGATAGSLTDLEFLESLEVPLHLATDDGSLGKQGNVLSLLEDLWRSEALPTEVRLLVCGPERMLEAAERLARERNLPCWLSLETPMGCGVGICNGCPVPTRTGGPFADWPNVKCCTEGPVFSTDAIDLTACVSGAGAGESGN